MDYEKKYKEALERAREYWETDNDNTLNIKAKGTMEYLFPELKESEDEKIKEALIQLVKCNERSGYFVLNNVSTGSMIAWLEKQGEQEPTTIDIDKMVDDYANNKERGNEEFGKPVNCMIRAYRQGLKDAIGKVVLKPTWSEEDENVLDDIEEAIINYWGGDTQDILLCWLKSLKQRIGG